MLRPLRAVSARKLRACRSDPDTMPKVRRSEREKGRVRGVHGAVGRKSRRGSRFATTHGVTAPDLSRSCVTHIATFRKPPRPATTLNNPTRTHGSNPARHTLPEKPVAILAEIFALPLLSSRKPRHLVLRFRRSGSCCLLSGGPQPPVLCHWDTIWHGWHSIWDP